MKAVLIAAPLALVLAGASAAQAQTEAPREAPTIRLAPPAPDPDPATTAPDRAARARDNLVAVRQGRIALADLPPLEQQDVIDLDRMTRGEGADNRSVKQQCIDTEVARAGGRPSRLAWEAIRLKCK